ncbi:Tyrosine-protein kinase [Fasciolopsis buskii]|uniref:Tyrosine-protein kinase n=1 Tax=Fasciolopsis buskii TaxID=27845 RepID=A0A8E0VIR1_9TREM|nr:Tyrosine-protein kinase [Fasciolopsis buski]
MGNCFGKGGERDVSHVQNEKPFLPMGHVVKAQSATLPRVNELNVTMSCETSASPVCDGSPSSQFARKKMSQVIYSPHPSKAAQFLPYLQSRAGSNVDMFHPAAQSDLRNPYIPRNSDVALRSQAFKHTQHPKADESSPRLYVSLFAYCARTEEEVSLEKGDRVAILNDNDPDWWFVEHQTTGNKGYVPTSYIALQGSVEVEDWFMSRMSRKDSERLLLLSSNPRGTFLIRPSETSQGECFCNVSSFMTR